MIDIKSISGETLLSVPVLKDAVSREELMTSDYVQLTWDSDSSDVLPVGTYIEHKGEKYFILEPYRPSMLNEVSFKYTPQFHSRIIRWQKIIVPVYTYSEDGATIKSREFDWIFTGTPADLLSMIQRAIYHETGETWSIDIAEGLSETVSISAQSSSVWDILSDLAEQCKTEWWADKGANKLSLSRCSFGLPFELEVGKSVRVPSVTSNNEGYYTRFYAFGSTRNITQDDGVVQGSIVSKRLTLDPKKYPEGYKDIKGHFENGVFVSDLKPEEVMVKSLYFEDVYPSSKLAIADVRRRMRYRMDSDGNKVRIGGTDEAPVYEQYAIWYFTLPELEFTEDLIIEGLTLSVAFKSGRLTGREFELAYHSEDKKVADIADVDENFTVHAGEYEIIFDESNGFILPDDDYIIPSDGDEVTLFNINMPDEYMASAREELETELDKAIEEYSKDNNSYEFESNPIYFYETLTDMKLGHAVKFINGATELETRVLMVEKHLDRPYEQKIRVGNVRIMGSRQQQAEEVRNISEEVEGLERFETSSSAMLRDHNRDLMITMGRYFAMRDTIDMLRGAIEGYTEGISPITVETMAMMVGDESLQFRFTASRSNLAPVDCPLVYNPSSKRMEASASALIHMTLGITSMTAMGVRDAADYRSWNMEAWNGDELTDPQKRYYVYAKAEREGENGTYALSETPVKMKDVPDYYFFLVGILNAEYAGMREFITVYGFTEILPSRITTDLIKSADGNTYFDLVKGIISGRITFRTSAGTDKSMADFADEQADSFSEVGKTIQQVQDQIDGVVENWSGNGTPTLQNEPYINWKTDADRIAHINDTYVNIESYVDDETTPTAGHAWRWCECTDESITEYVTVTDKDGKTYRLHWHEIADSDAVRALKEAAEAARKAEEASQKVSHLEYLTKVFEKGETIISGGVVMTEMVAVGEDSNNVSAVLNGSDYASDATHGKVILAGGIQEGDAAGLEERIGEAKTRIYEDGSVFSKSMNLEDDCTVGEYSLTQKGLEYVGGNQSMSLGYECLEFRISDYIYTRFGFPYENLGEAPNLVVKRNTTPSRMDGPVAAVIDAGVDGNSSKDGYSIAMQVDARGTYGRAFECNNGSFAGLRPQTRVVASSYSSSSRLELTPLDFSVLVNLVSGTVYMKLPDEPLDGQEYWIETKGAEINLTSSKGIWSHIYAAERTLIRTSGRVVVRFKYYAEAGQWTYTIAESYVEE